MRCGVVLSVSRLFDKEAWLLELNKLTSFLFEARELCSSEFQPVTSVISLRETVDTLRTSLLRLHAILGSDEDCMNFWKGSLSFLDICDRETVNLSAQESEIFQLESEIRNLPPHRKTSSNTNMTIRRLRAEYVVAVKNLAHAQRELDNEVTNRMSTI